MDLCVGVDKWWCGERRKFRVGGASGDSGGREGERVPYSR